MKISIGQQIEEVQRELVQREKVYPRLVTAGKLKRSHAEYQTERMRAVLATLQWLSDNEAAIKDSLAARKAAV
jgi:hypothetical protein